MAKKRKTKKKTSWAKGRAKRVSAFKKLSNRAKRGAFAAMGKARKLFKKNKSGKRLRTAKKSKV